MKRVFHLGVLVGVGVMATVACSAGESDGKKNPNGDGDAAQTGDGDGPSASGGTKDDIDPTVTGSGGTTGEPPDTVFEDPPLTMCETPQDCCDAIDTCNDAAEYVCTVDGYCGIIRDTCTDQADCQADTYCCIGPDCLGTNAAEGVCIPANVPPGADCITTVEPGVFAPAVQCTWSGDHVLSTPVVADLPIDSGDSAEIVVAGFDGTTNGDASTPGILRILSGQTCALLASIDDPAHRVRASATPALADLDNDGNIDIVARRNDGGVVAYRWGGSAYEYYWHSTADLSGFAASQNWDGISVHDLNDDGNPEVIARERVYNGQTGAVLDNIGNAVTGLPWNGMIPVLGDFDGDGKVEIVSSKGAWPWDMGIYEWVGNAWVADGASFGTLASHVAVADFGTPGVLPADFDWTTFDGIAEIVTTNHDLDPGRDHVKVYTLAGQEVFSVDTAESGCGSWESGGMPTIGDFDNDGRPEIGVAGSTHFRVFDPEGCATNPGSCQEPTRSVLWKQPSQDCTSKQTSASIFDFDGDGQAEAVYADECFLRVYDGTSGDVKYSAFRASGTWLENPVIADVDMDQNTEIVINSNSPLDKSVTCGGASSPYLDPIHPGSACDEESGCPNNMTCTTGRCRCTTSADCCGTLNLQECGLTCAPAIDGTSADGNVCRATHPNDGGGGHKGIRVLRDGLDRWASSRPMWNQHAYNITNINDDGSIPRTSEWEANWAIGGPNNFLQNAQGAAGIQDLPDITGRFSDDETCVTGASSSKVYLQATVCNRGKRSVGSELPATFYRGEASNGDVLCTSHTDGPVPTGGCKLVFCEIGADAAGESVTVVVNDDGNGGRSTVECRPDNNSDATVVESCTVPVPR